MNKALPSVDNAKNKNQNLCPLDVDGKSSDSDESISLPENESGGIHFQTRHFKRDSSSEDDIGPTKCSDFGDVMVCRFSLVGTTFFLFCLDVNLEILFKTNTKKVVEILFLFGSYSMY